MAASLPLAMADVRLDPLEALGPGHPVTLIVSLLPLDTRMRCRELNSAWRQLLEDTVHWRVLDMRLGSLSAAFVARLGGNNGSLHSEPAVQLYCNFVRVACARAKGTAEELLLEALGDTVIDVLVDSACGSLRRVSALDALNQHIGRTSVQQICRLLPLMPNLESLSVAACCSLQKALQLLRRESPFEKVEVTEVHIGRQKGPIIPGERTYVDAFARDLPAAAAACGSLTGLTVSLVNMLLDGLNHFVDAALAMGPRLRSFAFSMQWGDIEVLESDSYLIGLTRLLRQAPSLEELRIDMREEMYAPLLSFSELQDICAALRASRLHHLSLIGVSMFVTSGVAAVISAVAGHSTLSRLCIFWIEYHPDYKDTYMFGINNVFAAGEALCTLVAFPSALRSFDFRVKKHGSMYDRKHHAQVLSPLFKGVGRSVTLRELLCDVPENPHYALLDFIVAAVRANTSLQSLMFDWNASSGPKPAQLQEAERLVLDRQRQ